MAYRYGKRHKIDADTLKRNVGMRVRYHRDRVSQREFAEQLGITQAYLCKLERGEVDVSLSMLQRIADFQGQKIEVFLKGIETAHKTKDEYGYDAPPDRKKELFKERFGADYVSGVTLLKQVTAVYLHPDRRYCEQASCKYRGKATLNPECGWCDSPTIAGDSPA